MEKILSKDTQINPKLLFVIFLGIALISIFALSAIAEEAGESLPALQSATLVINKAADKDTAGIIYTKNNLTLNASLYRVEGEKYIPITETLFISPNKKFGATDNDVTKDSEYRYLFDSSNPITFDGRFYITYIGKNKVKLNIDDICAISYRDEEIINIVNYTVNEDLYSLLITDPTFKDSIKINNTKCLEIDNNTICEKNESYIVFLNIPNISKKVFFNPECKYDLIGKNTLSINFKARYDDKIHGIKIDPDFSTECDSGTVDTVCYLSHPYPSSDGENINGTGSLVIQSGGSIYNLNNLNSTVLNFSNITIQSGGNITGGNITIYTNNLTLESGAKIYTIDLGYKPGPAGGGTGQGPCPGSTYTGTTAGAACHGGYGGNNYLGGGGGIFVYGSSLYPQTFGSGGGSASSGLGGAGGGIITLNIVDTLDVSGIITSSGMDGTARSPGGAGGSILIKTYNLIGLGNISAKGGNAGPETYGGGGGGGRIAVYYNTSSFGGIPTSTVIGGVKSSQGFAGTVGTMIFIDQDDNSVSIKDGFRFQGLITRANETGTPNTSFWNTNNINAWNFTNLTIYGGSNLTTHNLSLVVTAYYLNVSTTSGFIWGYFENVSNSSTLTINVSSTNLNENLTNIYLNSYNNLTLSLPFAIRILNNSDIRIFQSGASINIVNKFNETLDIINSSYGALGNQTYISFGINDNIRNLNFYNGTIIYGGYVNISVDNFTMNLNTMINSTGLGYTQGLGPGAGAPVGATQYGSGGGHGGAGKPGSVFPPGKSYGSSLYPTTFGSGGGTGYYGNYGGWGGGIINLLITDTLSLNGTIAVNGITADRHAGGGAGGSIFVNTKNLNGIGTILATGGGGGIPGSGATGGGGGGRVAVYYNTSTYSGIYISSVLGGLGSTGRAEPGSMIFIDLDDNSATMSSAFRFQGLTGIDNESRNFTFWNTNNPSFWNFTNLTMFNATIAQTVSINILDYTLLTITNTTWGCGNSSLITLNLSQNNFTIDRYSTLDFSGCGYANDTGPSVGTSHSYAGSGGGHGGYGAGGGGASAGVQIGGLVIYGSSLNPNTFGSGGTKAVGNGLPGGYNGGGIIRLIINDTLILNGSIVANGLGGNNQVGGGAGGSINVVTKNLEGNGSFSASGGNGAIAGTHRGGGGGGGRIAVYYNTSSFGGMNISKVTGGVGGAGLALGGNVADPGTLIFVDIDSDSTIIKDGFKFQGLTSIANETGAANQSFWNTNNPNYYNFTNLTILGGAKIFNMNSSLTLNINYLNVTNSSGFIFDYFGTSSILIINVSSTNLNENLTNIDLYSYGNLNLTWPFAIRSLNSSDILINSTGSIINIISNFNETVDIINSSFGVKGNQTYVSLGINDNIQNLNLKTGTIIYGGYVNISVINLSIDLASMITTTGFGYVNGTGPGLGTIAGYASGGSSHAGIGGVGNAQSGGWIPGSTIIYGSSLEPNTYGTGGQRVTNYAVYGGYGGGIIHIKVINTFNLNGSLSSNGTGGIAADSSGRTGAASGGSIYVITKNLEGNGSLSAAGGNGILAAPHIGGAGGGGRIAVYYNSSSFTGIEKSNVLNGTGGLTTTVQAERGSMIFIDLDDNSAIMSSGFVFEGLTGTANESNTANYSFWNTANPLIYNFTNVSIIGLTRLKTQDNFELVFTDNLSITNAVFNASIYNFTISYRGPYTKTSYSNVANSSISNLNISNIAMSYKYFSSALNISGVDASIYPSLNKTATISFYNLGEYKNATGFRNGIACYPTTCSLVSNTTTETYYLNVTGFSNYSIGENPTGPSISWINTIPTDITTINLFDRPLNISYSITPLGAALNLSTIQIYHKTINGGNDNWDYVNGTYQYNGYINITFSTSNISENWTFRFTDNMVYPATYNLNESLMDTTTHTRQQLTSSNTYFATQLLNVSNVTQYNMFEIMSNSSSIQRIYYCNSSFTTNTNPSAVSYCTLIATLPANQAYNHTHTVNSKHQVVPVSINITTGQIGTVKVTPTSWFISRGNTGGGNTVNVYSINVESRTGATKTSTNSGGSWSDQVYTIDTHLHQYNGSETFYYYVCANDTDNQETCSSEKYDLLKLGGLPPQISIFNPIEQLYDRYINITYSALSPNAYNISNYTINLYNSTLSFEKILNYSSNGLSYYWDSINTTAGEYIIGTQACDILNQFAILYSDNFTVSAGIVTLITPQNNTVLERTTNTTLNVTISGSNNSIWNVSFYDATIDIAGVLLGTVYGVANGATASYEWLGLVAGTTYSWFVSMTNGVATHNSSIYLFTPNDEPKLKNLRIENITGSCATIVWDNEANMDWVSFKIGNEVLELRSITSIADNWTTCDLYPNQQYILEFQTGDSLHSISDYYNFSFRTSGWNPELVNYSYRRLITINESLIAITADNQAINLSLNDTNFLYYDPVNYVYYPSFLHLNYTNLTDIRFVDYYDVKFLPFNITYSNIPGEGGVSYQTIPDTHIIDGPMVDGDKMFDGDWNTFGTPDLEATYYFNYTIPVGAKNTSLFRLYAGEWLWDTELESDCWGGTSLQFKSEMNYTNASISTYCLNQSQDPAEWIGIHSSWAPFAPFASRYFYETMMTWQYDTELDINIIPEYFNYGSQSNIPGISNNYSVQFWMYYGNNAETINNESTLTIAGIEQDVFILGDETEVVYGDPIISNLNSTEGRTATGTNISWHVDQIVDNRIQLSTNPFIMNASFVSRIVNTSSTHNHLYGNMINTVILSSSPEEYLGITNVSCSNNSYSLNFTVNNTADPITITFLDVYTTEYLDWNVTILENKSWIRSSASPEFVLGNLITNTQYWYKAWAYGTTGNDSEIGTFTLGTVPIAPSVVILNYTENRPNKQVIICGNLTSMSGEAEVNVSFQYFNQTDTGFRETSYNTLSAKGTFCKTINVEFGENMTYRAKGIGATNGSGYSEAYYDLFNNIYEFFVGNPSIDPTTDLPRQYCAPKLDGTADTGGKCYEQQGYREGTQRPETFMYIETNASGFGSTLTVNLINGSTIRTYPMVSGPYFNYTNITGLINNWYTLYITDTAGNVILNLTKPGMIHLINVNRTDASKYISFAGTQTLMSSTYFYMKNPGVYNTSAYQWCQAAPGGNLYDCMSLQYWGGGVETGLSRALSGTAYDRGGLFRGGIMNGELKDTGILEYSRNSSNEVVNDLRMCFAFTVYYINESIIPSNNITNYYYRYWKTNEWYSDYMGYAQPSTFHESYLFKWKYDEVALTRDWRKINGTSSSNQLSVLDTVNNTFNSQYNQTLKVGFVDGFSTNLTGDDIYQSGLYLDGQWINQQIGKYQQGFVVFNLPDNATLDTMDTDGDGLSDKNELFLYYTNPYSNDTDEDHMSDYAEIMAGYNPNLYNSHTSPIANLTNPGNETYHNSPVTLTVRASAISGIHNASLYINGAYNNSYIFSYFENGSIDISSLLSFAQGEYYWYYTIEDETGLSTTSNIRMFTVEYTSPNMTMILPLNNSMTNGSSTNFSANVTDTISGINNFSVYIFNNDTGVLVASENISTPLNPLEALLGITVSLANGVYTWFLEAFDLAGNLFRSGNYTLTVDLIAPDLEIISPTNAVYNNGTIIMNISYNDTYFNSVWYTLNGVTAPYYGDEIINLGDGNYTLTAYANDTAGNINTTSVNFTIDNTNLTYCKNLTRANVNYTLMTDILNYGDGTCFRINADNISIYGNNYKIQGAAVPVANSYAIYSNNTHSINISGFGSIENFYNGIGLLEVNDSYVETNIIYANTVNGILSNLSYNNMIYNNSIHQNGVVGKAAGIYLISSGNNSLIKNYMYGGNIYGLIISENSTYNRIYNNSISSSILDGIYIYNGSDYNIFNNNILSSNYRGIEIGLGIKNNYFINQYISSASPYRSIVDDSLLTGTEQNYLIYNNSFGEIRWTNMSFMQNLTMRGDIISPTTILITNNSAFVNSSIMTLGRLNSSANITLYGTPGAGLTNPLILINGRQCLDCYNFTSLLNETVIFNVTHWSNYTIGEDAGAPSINFIYPTLNASSYSYWYNSGIFIKTSYFNINVTANDPSLVNITIYLYNSTLDLINSTNSTFSPLYVEYSNLTQGIYYFNASAWDDFGNDNYTETRNFTVDFDKPNATLIEPLSGAYINHSTNINLTVNASDSIGLWKFNLTIYNSSGYSEDEPQIETGTQTSSIGVFEALIGIMNTLADDVYHWFYRVYDLAGNLNSTSSTIRNFTVDTILPNILVYSPQNTTYDNGTILLNISVTDVNFNKTQYNYNGTLMDYTGVVNIYTIDGERNITIYAYDLAGNVNITQINFTVDNLNTSNCKPLTRAGKTYNLINDSFVLTSTCFDIRNDNITLNGMGHYISGDAVPATGDYGIYSNGYKNLTIENFSGISDFDIGISLYSVNNSIIRNTYLSSNIFSYGFYIDGYTKNNNILNNVIDSNPMGLRVIDGNNYIIYNNTFSSSTLAEGAKITGINNTVIGNRFFDNFERGLYVVSFRNGTIINNTIYENTHEGLDLSNSNNNIIDNNLIRYNIKSGIQLSGSSTNNTLLNNNIYDNDEYEILDISGISTTNYLIYNNSFGEIKWINTTFLDNLTIEGYVSFPGNINISFNIASINLSVFTIGGINSSANITLYGTPSAGIITPTIKKDGTKCLDCYNFTSLFATTVKFNVTSLSDYKLGEESTHPIVCSELNLPNTIYYLEADILNYNSNCFLISAENITFNGNGHIVDGNDSGVTYGIYSLNAYNTTIYNFSRISDWGFGIMLVGSQAAGIRDTSLSSNIYDIFLSNVNYSSFSNITTTNSNRAIYLHTNVFNNTFNNINFFNHSSYSIYDNSSLTNYFTYNNSYGIINFVNNSFKSNLTFMGNLTFPGQVNISYNLASVNTNLITQSRMNSSFNVTLYMTPGSFVTPVVGRNSQACTTCYNFTDLNSDIAIFNTTFDGYYFVLENESVVPLINFTSPTPASDTYVNVSYIPVNISVTDANFANVTIYVYNYLQEFVNSSIGYTTNYYMNMKYGAGLTSGVYYINATTCDYTPNCNSTETRRVFLDVVVPNATLGSPSNNIATTVLEHNFTVNITDNVLLLYTNYTKYPGSCYQESANITNQKGNDGNCTLNYSGNYNMYISNGGNIEINYSKPIDALNTSLWKIKGGSSAYLSIPTSCWNAYSDTLSFRMRSRSIQALPSVNPGSYFYCHNGTDWEMLYSVIGSEDGAFGPGDWMNAIDGDWDTYSADNFYTGPWTNNGLAFSEYMRLYEEAMVWNMTDKTVIETIDGISNVSFYIYNSTGELYNQTNVSYSQGVVNVLVGIQVTLVDGLYSWFYRVIDFASNIRQSDTRNITIVTTEPTVVFIYPTNSSGIYSSVANITVNISSEDISMKNVSVRFYNSSFIEINNMTWTNSFSNIFYYVTPGLAEGIYYYNATSCNAVQLCDSTETRVITINFHFAGGDGTSGAPYQISSWSQLNNSKLNQSKYYILVSNLSSSSLDYIGYGNNWTPIGINALDNFSGNVDGNNYNISDLIINSPNQDYLGLFGYVTGNISKLRFSNISVIGRDYVGGLVGYSTGNISNCSILNGNVTGRNYIGGLVGYSSGAVSSSYASGAIRGMNEVGGIAGYSNGDIYGSYLTSSGNIYGNTKVGGLVGNNSGQLRSSYSEIDGIINGSNYIGSLIGYAGSSSQVTSSYSLVKTSSTVQGYTNVGFIGYNNGGSLSGSYLTIRNNPYGNITFLELITEGSGNMLGNITVDNNYVFVNSTAQPTFNKSANISILGTRTDFINPNIYRNRLNICNTSSSPTCSNFTNLNSGMAIFNVSSWSDYSIDGEGIQIINFVIPTENNVFYINRSYILANVTATSLCFAGVDCLANISVQLYNSTHDLINLTINNTPDYYYVNISNGISGLGSGIYYMNATSCNNESDCISTETRTIYIDRLIPNATLMAPPNGTLSVNSSYNFTVNITDNILAVGIGGIANGSLNIFNGSNDLYNQSNFSFTYGITESLLGITVTLADGMYSWFYRVMDFAHNTFQSDTWNVTADFEVPQLVILSPQADAAYAPEPVPLEFNFTAEDLHMDRCWYRNETVGYDIDLPGCANIVLYFAEGVHTLNLWANDTLGNIAQANVTFLVTTPTVLLNNPINNTNFSYQNNILFNYSVTSNSSLDTCQLWGSWNGGWHLNETNNTIISNETQNNFSLKNIADGEYAWNVWCNNSEGVGQFARNNWTFTIDSTAPLINITEPINGTIILTSVTDVNYTVSDLHLESCWWTNDSGRINHTISCGTNISYTLIEGINNITIYANDTFGNINFSSVTFSEDTVGPRIDWGTGVAVNGSVLAQNYIFMNITLIEPSCANTTYYLNDDETIYVYNATNNVGLNYDGNYTWNPTSGQVQYKTGDPAWYNADKGWWIWKSQFSGNYYLTDNIGVDNTGWINTAPGSYLGNTWLGSNPGYPTTGNLTTTNYYSYNFDTCDTNFTLSGLTDGNYEYYVAASDVLGNTNQTTKRNITLDNNPPTNIVITYPLNTSYPYIIDHINFTAYDLTNSTCWYGNDTLNSSVQNCGSGNIVWGMYGITATHGGNHWTVYVNDSFGRVNSTDVRFVYNYEIIVVPSQPSVEGVSAVAGGFDVNFTAEINASAGLTNVSLFIYNQTTYIPANLFNYTIITYPAGTFTTPWLSLVHLVRGVYYWWFEAFDIFAGTYVTNVSNLTVDVPTVIIVQPANNSNNFSASSIIPLQIVTNQLIEYCWYSLNDANNITFYPDINIQAVYGDNNITVWCHNENGTDYASHNFKLYPYPSLGLSIESPKEGQMYRYADQKISWSYDTSYTISSWNYSLNNAANTTMVSGTTIKFPIGSNTVRICGTTSNPLPAPYYNNFSAFQECDDVTFLISDALTGAVTDMTLYLWASLFAVTLAIFFAYISGSENLFQFLVRVIWYSGEMIIGFGIIVEGIKFIRISFGIAPG